MFATAAPAPRATPAPRAARSTTPPSSARASARASSSGADVLYFCYGSNLNPSTFDGVRGMRPTSSTPCVLRGFELAFNVPGVPYVEPAFASAVAREGAECHGVAHGITRDEWEYLVTTEGSYDVVDVDCDAYDGRKLRCKTLTHRTLKNFGERAPSLRYATLLREGARFHGLDEAWIARLDALETYEPVELDLGQRAALALSVGPTLLAAVPAAGAAAAKRLSTGDGRGAVIDAFVETQDVVWGVQNAFFAPWMGSSGRNAKK
jgi:hypothetical protein